MKSFLGMGKDLEREILGDLAREILTEKDKAKVREIQAREDRMGARVRSDRKLPK